MINLLIRALKKGASFLPRKPAAPRADPGRFYSQFVRPGELCFDVGANMGNRVETFLKIGARVVAVEPQDDCARSLTEKYGPHENFKLVQTALGAAEGESEMLISDANTISSLSSEWVQSMQASGRFAGHEWNRRQKVAITTLDRLIRDFGEPVFIKIDVEGFELQVVSGLSRPVRSLSFEFTPEFIGETRKIVAHLRKLGEVRFNYSMNESLVLGMQEWVNADGIAKLLSGFEGQKATFGDIYARFPV